MARAQFRQNSLKDIQFSQILFYNQIITQWVLHTAYCLLTSKMSGHSKWAQIKHQKGVADEKRGRLFSKLLNAISAAAKLEPNPNFNPRLRAAIEKAKENNVPKENIERAIKKASEPGQKIEKLIFEAYGPGGTAILIEAISDNKNRSIAEIKKVLTDHEAKWAEEGSVRWAFEQIADQHGLGADSQGNWKAKFQQEISESDKRKLKNLVEALENREDVQMVYTNSNF